MNEQTAAPTHFSRKEVRQYCTFERTDAKSGRVCSHFSLHVFGRAVDDWAFISQTPRWCHVALSCTLISPIRTSGAARQS